MKIEVDIDWMDTRIEESVVQECASRITKKIEDDVLDRVWPMVQERLDERMDIVVENLLAQKIPVEIGWDGEVEDWSPLGQMAANYVKEWAETIVDYHGKPKPKGSYPNTSDKTRLQWYLHEVAGKDLDKQLRAKIAELVKEIRDGLHEQVNRLMTERFFGELLRKPL